jgi:hypothetical protein
LQRAVVIEGHYGYTPAVNTEYDGGYSRNLPRVAIVGSNIRMGAADDTSQDKMVRVMRSLCICFDIVPYPPPTPSMCELLKNRFADQNHTLLIIVNLKLLFSTLTLAFINTELTHQI